MKIKAAEIYIKVQCQTEFVGRKQEERFTSASDLSVPLCTYGASISDN